jgi:hypothetical protein
VVLPFLLFADCFTDSGFGITKHRRQFVGLGFICLILFDNRINPILESKMVRLSDFLACIPMPDA